MSVRTRAGVTEKAGEGRRDSAEAGSAFKVRPFADQAVVRKAERGRGDLYESYLKEKRARDGGLPATQAPASASSQAAWRVAAQRVPQVIQRKPLDAKNAQKFRQMMKVMGATPKLSTADIGLMKRIREILEADEAEGSEIEQIIKDYDKFVSGTLGGGSVTAKYTVTINSAVKGYIASKNLSSWKTDLEQNGSQASGWRGVKSGTYDHWNPDSSDDKVVAVIDDKAMTVNIMAVYKHPKGGGKKKHLGEDAPNY